MITGPYTLTLVEPATETVLSVPEAKDHLRETGTDQDGLIAGLIAATTQHVEEVTNRKLLTQQWALRLKAFPCATYRNPWAAIELPFPPLQSVDQIAYVDPDGATKTVAAEVYEVVPGNLVGQVRLKYDQEWPDTRCQAGAVTITFTCGYGGAEDVPDAVKAAMLALLADLYENREAQIVGTIVAQNAMVAGLLAPYRVVELV